MSLPVVSKVLENIRSVVGVLSTVMKLSALIPALHWMKDRLKLEHNGHKYEANAILIRQ